ncbi:MAG TPA: ATP-binding protein [Longimicrobiales bacterium]|nr:ATP-binding protein [Longimicrobiales bacterium]
MSRCTLAAMFGSNLLRWLYLARLTLATGIFAAALLVWTRPQIAPETTLVAALMLVLSLAFTVASFWYTHIAARQPGGNFLYAQALFDVLLVTAVVHITGRGESDFAPLYVLVIAEGALLLPLRGGFLVGALATLVYFADAVWGGGVAAALGGAAAERDLGGDVLIRMVIFGTIALATAWLGERVRRTGTQLGAVESALRQLRLDTSDILDTLDTGVVTVDDEGRLSYMNPAAEQLLGMRARDWLGRSALEQMERVAPGMSSVVQRTLGSRAPVRWYETHTRATPELRVLGVRSTTLERDQHPWVTVVLQDITDGKRAEALNRRAERLEAVAELAASLAHEIKNPLASIRSAVEQLTTPDGRLRMEDRGTLGTLVLTESDRLSRLLSGFIEFSRVELSERKMVDVSAVVRGAVEVARQHPDAAEAAPVRLHLPERLLVEGDADLLHRAVFNLVLNAIQHSPPDEAVTVAVDAVAQDALPPGADFTAGARISIADRGPGVRPEDAARVFDPFFTTRRGGSGLGLALVHRAVQAHEGLIFIDGGDGGGTTFTVYIPLRLRQVAG